MRFVVNDSRLRFGLGEFALVTGLKYKGDTSIESIAENRFISKYFGTASVTFAQLADCFKKKKWETDDDALKIAILYFVNNFLLSQLKTKLKNITPTDDEKQLFDVRGLSFEIEVECTDSQPDSFQVFGTQLPKTQSMHESTGSDSQLTNAEVMKELQALKLFIKNKFEEVLAAIGRQSMKPEGNSVFESGHVGNDPVVIGDSTPKAPSISDFGGVGQDGGATGVNVKNVTASDGVVNDDLRSAPFVNEHDFGLDSNFELSASAIDQITAITQQATYKQSSHDVKKSGPALLPSGIPVQTRADVVIESNTAPQGNELTTRAVNKSKPDQSVSRSIVQIQTDVETTPAVFTRRRRPAAVKQSPYRNDWQSGVSAVGGSSKVIKGRFPFVNDISETVDFKLTTAFSNFVEANMQLGECIRRVHS
ncbi:hypothetical protein A4A49_13314 [Nicotiana attenuata]|uniref:DUF1985 domain-containing protein n=1 Tax=Nicotiana attenuata TaxID=49451 RepID=A0A1J6IME5_NICAT|nr:hypothetical protein A4A49_13314 [Nicotiana attenuata]